MYILHVARHTAIVRANDYNMILGNTDRGNAIVGTALCLLIGHRPPLGELVVRQRIPHILAPAGRQRSVTCISNILCEDMDVYMTASLTHGNSDNVVNTVTITNGNFDDATITTQLGQMLASVNLTLDDAELPNLELLAAEIQNGKMELALSVNPADSSVTLAITSVVYDTQAYVPSSVEVAVTVEYVFHTNLSTPTPAYEPYYEKVLERVNEYIELATKAIANTLLIIFMFAVAAAVVYGTISTGTVLLSLLTCLFVR